MKASVCAMLCSGTSSSANTARLERTGEIISTGPPAVVSSVTDNTGIQLNILWRILLGALCLEAPQSLEISPSHQIQRCRVLI
eukprot:6485154-Prymnesium_polylepis.1